MTFSLYQIGVVMSSQNTYAQSEHKTTAPLYQLLRPFYIYPNRIMSRHPTSDGLSLQVISHHSVSLMAGGPPQETSKNGGLNLIQLLMY